MTYLMSINKKVHIIKLNKAETAGADQKGQPQRFRQTTYSEGHPDKSGRR